MATVARLHLVAPAVNPPPGFATTSLCEMDIDEMSAVGLSQAQQEGLQKLLPILDPKVVEYLIAQGEEEVNKRIHMLESIIKL